ncbi:hypothetical protein CARUB_v10021507mg [Capsella rubella]|uniref:Uncharacterized protein n=1 Tax=Capsella rubella TaxID=81985 RepID=R0GEH6_9BRAS|nr:hypothetical protein CARUB_v10021507mg [Capsella rubella]
MVSNKSFIAFLYATMMIILVVFCGTKEARKYLGYGALAKDRDPTCSFHYPKGCIKHESNHYHRGCETSTRCRRDS